MKKLLSIGLLFFVSIGFAQDTKEVEWGEETFFKKTWPEAVLFCAEKKQRLGLVSEFNASAPKTNDYYWKFESEYTKTDSEKVRCVKNDANKSIDNLKFIVSKCEEKVKLAKEQDRKEMEEDNNKTFSDKLKDFGNSIASAGGRAAKATVGAGLGALSFGSVGGSMVESAFTFEQPMYPAMTENVCQEAKKYLTQLSDTNAK